MTLNTRRRSNKFSFGGTYYRKWNDYPYQRHLSAPRTTSYDETQVTVSEGHQWPPRSGAPKGDIGGAFSTTRSYVESNNGPSLLLKGNDNIGFTGEPKATEWYHGVVGAAVPAGSPFPTPSPMSNSDMNIRGATAVSRCKPTNSAADLGTFLGELLKDGLPSFTTSQSWSKRTQAAQAAGDDYLNVQFGWQPLLNDVNKFVQLVDTSYSALQQVRRDEGRLVRRRYQFPTETTVTETLVQNNGVAPSLSNKFVNVASATLLRRTEVIRDVWFSGAFRYFLPASLKGESALEELRATAELNFGLAITPEVLWNIAPWSWMVDWFSNTGDVISNISDSQRYGLIMPYGYLMVHTIAKNTFTLKGATFVNSSKGSVASSSFITETKQRSKANPFGFGITDSSLTSGQVSILAALGLSRSR